MCDEVTETAKVYFVTPILRAIECGRNLFCVVLFRTIQIFVCQHFVLFVRRTHLEYCALFCETQSEV